MDRLIIVAALARQHVNRNWIVAPDNQVPANATMYAVYDGAALIGGGVTVSRAAEMVKRAEMPIVFYQLSGKEAA